MKSEKINSILHLFLTQVLNLQAKDEFSEKEQKKKPQPNEESPGTNNESLCK